MFNRCIARYLNDNINIISFDTSNNKIKLYNLYQKNHNMIEYYIIDQYNEIYWLKNQNLSNFILYKIPLSNIYHCIDCNLQTVSGKFKHAIKKNEKLIYVLDKETNTAYFRIAKNGSSQLFRVYFNTPFEFAETEENLKKIHFLVDKNQSDISNTIQYCVLRDTKSRFFSQINHMLKFNLIPAYPRNIYQYIYNSAEQLSQFILVNYIIMDYFGDKIPNLEQDCHLMQQSYIIKKFLQYNINFTYIVMLKDLPLFMDKVLHKQNTNYSLTGHNTKITSASNEIEKQLQYFIDQDNKIFQYFSDKIWGK